MTVLSASASNIHRHFWSKTKVQLEMHARRSQPVLTVARSNTPPCSHWFWCSEQRRRVKQEQQQQQTSSYFSTFSKRKPRSRIHHTKRKPSLFFTCTSDQKWKLPCLIHQPPSQSSTSEGSSTSTSSKGSGSDRLTSSAFDSNRNSSPNPILLICGWGGCGTIDWGAIPSMLAHKTNRPVLTYDARGLGNSSRNRVRVPVQEKGEIDDDDQLLSMDIMASDALSVIQHYYQFQRSASGNENSNNGQTIHTGKCCVGGVSMGGMVAQSLAIKLAERSQAGDGSDGNIMLPSITLSSLGLICSSPLLHYEQQRHKDTTEMPFEFEYRQKTERKGQSHEIEHHFLNAFDDWTDDCDNSKLSATKRFFDALGHDFLQMPGRKKLRKKLIESFLSSRKEFTNGVGLEMILAQKDVLLREGTVAVEPASSSPSSTIPNISKSVLSDSHNRRTGGDKELLKHIDKSSRLPTMVIHGRKDSVIPHTRGERLHTLFNSKSSRLDILDDCDHLCWITHGPELVNIMGIFWKDGRF